MTGTFQGFDLAFGSFGQQYTAIDGQRYVSWFDLADKDLTGLPHGFRVEFIARPAPTLLCHSPRIEDNLPSAKLVRVLANTVPGTGSSQEARQ